MSTFRTTSCACGILFLAAALPAWSRHPQTKNTAIDPDLLAARESAWRAYFAGDLKTLGDLLPPEFIGIGMNEGPFADRATTLEGARTFRERGAGSLTWRFPKRARRPSAIPSSSTDDMRQ